MLQATDATRNSIQSRGMPLTERRRMALRIRELNMCSEEERLKTFKNWAFKSDANCSANNMASAGFYCVGTEQEVDLAKCYVCFKEIDGFEEDDDPKTYHYRHCQFYQLNNRSCEMTVVETIKMESYRHQNTASKILMKKIQDILPDFNPVCNIMQSYSVTKQEE